MLSFVKKQVINLKLARKHIALRGVPGVCLARGVTVDLFTMVAPYVTVGSHCNIASSSIGQGTYLAEFSTVRHTRVGRFCSIADNVRTGNGSHPTRTFVSTHPAFFSPLKQAGFAFVDKQLFEEMPRAKNSSYVVEIGNDVWIGSGVRVLDGVRIGDGAIVGAGAVVTKDIEPYAIYAGVPARRVRFRFSPEVISFLVEFSWWNRDFTWLEENAQYFTDIDLFCERFRSGRGNAANE
jgi:acetyltransferase-like isoleucine patch superfamily enzyme